MSQKKINLFTLAMICNGSDVALSWIEKLVRIQKYRKYARIGI